MCPLEKSVYPLEKEKTFVHFTNKREVEKPMGIYAVGWSSTNWLGYGVTLSWVAGKIGDFIGKNRGSMGEPVGKIRKNWFYWEQRKYVTRDSLPVISWNSTEKWVRRCIGLKSTLDEVDEHPQRIWSRSLPIPWRLPNSRSLAFYLQYLLGIKHGNWKFLIAWSF